MCNLSESSVLFPNLHIVLRHVGKAVSIGGFEIAYYGIVIAAAMALGIFLMTRIARKTGQNEEMYFDMAMIVIICAVIGARLYYVIFSWEDYRDDLLQIFNLRGGGLAIYGGVIAGVLAVWGFARVKKQKTLELLDTACPGLILGQIIGRWGNFFNREAFGGYSNGLLAMALPKEAVRQGEITAKMLEQVKVTDGIEFIQVHPTFLYESLWNLGILVILLLLWKKRRFRGQIFLTYLLGYGLGRLWIEGLRTDQLLIPGIGLPVSQALSGILVVVSGAALLILGLRTTKMKKPDIGHLK